MELFTSVRMTKRGCELRKVDVPVEVDGARYCTRLEPRHLVVQPASCTLLLGLQIKSRRARSGSYTELVQQEQAPSKCQTRVVEAAKVSTVIHIMLTQV